MVSRHQIEVPVDKGNEFYDTADRFLRHALAVGTVLPATTISRHIVPSTIRDRDMLSTFASGFSRFGRVLLAGVLPLLVPASNLSAQEGSLEIGTPVPSFSAQTDEDTEWNLDDHVGEDIVVVYFYPAAMTGGCTTQACAFRDHKSALADLGAVVVGVSGDEPSSLKVFKASHNLNFPLLSDPDGSVAEVFGVPTGDGGTIKRTVEGEEVELVRGVTSARWTFVIDLDGKLAYKNTEVNPERDSQEVLGFISNLRSGE